jgi:hypothetical protein
MKEKLPKIYLDFINECKLKHYGEIPTHTHHILPKFMGGADSKENLIKLSIEDHYLAHKILSETCKSEYKNGNKLSAAFLMNRYNGFEISKEEIGKLISEAKKGKPAWNKGKKGLYKHSEESKRKIAEKMKARVLTDEHKRKISESQKGITLEMRYGKEKAMEIKSKNCMKNPEIVEKVFSKQRGIPRPNTSESLKKWWEAKKSIGKGIT